MRWIVKSKKDTPLNQIMQFIDEWGFDTPLVITVDEYNEKRSKSQNGLCHLWYRVIAHWLKANDFHYIDANTGKKIYNTEKHVKETLKKEILGVQTLVDRFGDVKEFTIDTSDLSKAETHHFMNRIYEKFYTVGLILPVPEDSVYQKLEDKQNA